MPSANVGTETRVEVGTEVGINVGIGTGVKKGRAGKGTQQKMEDPSCMINLTSGSLAQGQPYVIQANLRNKLLTPRGVALPAAPCRVRKMDRSTIHQERKRNSGPA